MESNAHPSSSLDVPTSAPSLSKNKGGAPSSFIWKFFSRLEQYNKKTNRYRAQCNFCQHVIEDGRVENLHKHILRACLAATSETKQYVQAELDKKAVEQAANPSRKAAKKEAGQTPQAARGLTARPITDNEQEELDIKLLRFLIMSSLPCSAVETAWVLDFFHTLNPAYVPAGALKLQTSVLANDYANSKAALDFRLAQEERINVSLDTWMSVSNQTAYACNVQLIDGTTALLGAQEVSNDAESAADVAGVTMKWIIMLDPAKVGSLCTDNVGSVPAARSLIPSMPGCSHIVHYRCPMHAFSLAICSMLGFPWAKTVVGTAQQLAIHFSTNPTAVEVLAAEARQLGQTAQLSPCSLSQVQSVHACLQSLLALQTAIKQAVAKCTGADAHFMGLEAASSDTFWSQVQGLQDLLAPFAEAVASIQARTATLADITLYLLKLAKALEAAKAANVLPADFMAHCCHVFCWRTTELDEELCWLALLLDPRYRQIAVPGGSPPNVAHKAKSLFDRRGGDHTGHDRLMSQLGAYLAQQPPFDLPFTQTTAQSWWQRVGGHQIGVATAELVSLAVFVCDLAPHAASVERVSSLMGWYHTPVRSSLSTETLAMMVALKAHLQLHVPSVSKPLQAQWQHSEGPQLLDIPPLGANAAPQQLMQRLQLFHDQSVLSIQASTVTVSSLSLAAQSNMDHPALLSGLESQLPTAAQPHLAGIPVPRVNAHEFVRACFAEMGGKR